MLVRFFLIVSGLVIFLFFPLYALQVGARIVLLMFLAAFLFSRIPLHFLRVKIEQPLLRCFLYEKETIKIIISNTSFLPILSLCIRDNVAGLSANEGNVRVVSIPARSQFVLEYQVWSQYRGLYKLGPLRLLSSDPLGLFPWESNISQVRLVFVYPRIEASYLPLLHGFSGGPIKTKNPLNLDTSRMRSLRPYETGDDPRYIHWKASAKTGTLHVGEYEKSINVPYYLVLNLNEEDFHSRRKAYHLERCIEAAASIIDEAAKQHCSLGFATNGTIPSEARRESLGQLDYDDKKALHFPLSSAQDSAAHLLSYLSVIRAQNGHEMGFFPAFLPINYQTSPKIIVITPPLNPVEFEKIITFVPRQCRMDFWFLEEHQDRKDRMDHRGLPPLSGISLKKLPEYSGDFVEMGYLNA